MKKALIVALMMVAGIAQAQQDCSPVVDAIQKSIAPTMKDPGSIQLRNIKFYQYTDEKGKDSFMAMGELNGKNSYGGYVGFMPFGINLLSTPKGPFAFAHVIANSPVNSKVMDQIFTAQLNNAKLVCTQQ